MNVLWWCYWHHLPSAGFAAKEVAKVLFSTSYPSFVRPLGLKIFDCQFCNRRPLDRIGFAGLRFPPKLHWNFVLKKVSRVPIIGFHWHFPPETIPWLDIVWDCACQRWSSLSCFATTRPTEWWAPLRETRISTQYCMQGYFFFNSRGWTFSLTCVPPFFWPIPTNWPNIGFKNRVTTALGIFSNSRSRFYNKTILNYHVSHVCIIIWCG